ncbi:MAG: hypothetical protein K2L99_08705, partial [Muribaculaceae bacterium]|nr:hypothetical protein [Muribaculaceae bacterium]
MAATDTITRWCGSLEQSLLSLVKVALMSRRPSRVPAGGLRNPDELVILANGPSRNATVEAHSDFLASRTLLAVNFCATSEMYTRLQPQLY